MTCALGGPGDLGKARRSSETSAVLAEPQQMVLTACAEAMQLQRYVYQTQCNVKPVSETSQRGVDFRDDCCSLGRAARFVATHPEYTQAGGFAKCEPYAVCAE